MTRVALAELPLARFLPPPTPSHPNLAHMCSSPVLSSAACPPSPSRPSKRGPPTPSSHAHAPHTPKRHIVDANVSISVLDTDDLGVGRSPVRRLFTPGSHAPRDIHNHNNYSYTHNHNNHAHPLQNPTNSNTDPQDATPGLAPSPPISRRPSPLTSAPGTPKRSIHDIGFVIYCDEQDDEHESHTVPAVDDNAVPPDADDENMPPPQADTTPRAKRRTKAVSTPVLRPLRSSTPLARA